MAKLTKLERVAYHEAGHAVIAHVCGSRVKRATIKPEGDCLGRVIHSFPLGGDPESEMTAGMVDKIERRILFLFAGQSAEQQAAGRYNWVGAGQDFHNAVELASRRFDGKLLEKYLAYLRERAINLTTGNFRLIRHIAKLLLKRTTINGHELREAIRAWEEMRFGKLELSKLKWN